MSHKLTFTARQGEAVGIGSVTIGTTASPTKPLLIASSVRAPYPPPPAAPLPFHTYLDIDLKQPDGALAPEPWPMLVNIDGRLRPTGEADRQLWTQIAAGAYDAIWTMAGLKGTILTIFHEPNVLQGTAPEFRAAITRVYTVVKLANPATLVGPCLLGNWADPGFVAPDGSRLVDWLDIPMDFLGADRYPVMTGKDFDTLNVHWFQAAAAYGVPLLICETAAATGFAKPYYDSVIVQAPAHADLLGVALWLSKGPRGDHRPSMLTAPEQASLAALVASPAFGRSL